MTGEGVVDRIITNLGVLDVAEGRAAHRRDLADGVTEAEFRARDGGDDLSDFDHRREVSGYQGPLRHPPAEARPN